MPEIVACACQRAVGHQQPPESLGVAALGGGDDCVSVAHPRAKRTTLDTRSACGRQYVDGPNHDSHHLPARLLRRLRHPGDTHRRRDQERARRRRPPDQPRQAVPQVHDRLQRRVPRPRPAADHAASPGRRQGRGPVRADHVGRGDCRDRRAPGRHRRHPRRRHHPERALHRHLLAAGGQRPDAVLQPAGRDRGGSRFGLQQGRARRARLRLRQLGHRVRPAHGGRQQLHPGVGRQPLGVGAPPARALAGRGGRRS